MTGLDGVAPQPTDAPHGSRAVCRVCLEDVESAAEAIEHLRMHLRLSAAELTRIRELLRAHRDQRRAWNEKHDALEKDSERTGDDTLVLAHLKQRPLSPFAKGIGAIFFARLPKADPGKRIDFEQRASTEDVLPWMGGEVFRTGEPDDPRAPRREERAA